MNQTRTLNNEENKTLQFTTLTSNTIKQATNSGKLKLNMHLEIGSRNFKAYKQWQI